MNDSITILPILDIMNSTSPNTTITNHEQHSLSNFERIGNSYKEVHGYISLVGCIFGIIFNVLNIIVLTRKHMRSPTNFILLSLAIVDLFTICNYSVKAVYLYIVMKPACIPPHERSWMYFILVNEYVVVTGYNVSMWITVVLAVFRYIIVCRRQLAPTFCSMQRAKLSVLVTSIAAILVCLPYYFLYDVDDPDGDGGCGYIIVFSHIANTALRIFALCILGLVIKLFPSIIMTALSIKIVITLQQAKKRRVRLLSNASTNTKTKTTSGTSSAKEHNRAIMMLIAIVICSIIAALPQCIMLLISVMDKHFFTNVYIPLVEIMILLVLFNSAVNFIFYYTMSKEFRRTVNRMFGRIISKDVTTSLFSMSPITNSS